MTRRTIGFVKLFSAYCVLEFAISMLESQMNTLVVDLSWIPRKRICLQAANCSGMFKVGFMLVLSLVQRKSSILVVACINALFL